MFIKYSISKIDHVFKDYKDFTRFIKSAGVSNKKYSKRIFNKVAGIPIIKENPDNYTFIRNRSISSHEFWGPNQNWDSFPDNELRTKFSTFLNCRVDVDHIWNDDMDTIGIVLDSSYIPPQILITAQNELIPYKENILKDLLEEGQNIKIIGGYIENLLAIDNERAEAHTPGLTTAIKNGEVSDTSMGCSCELSECSICGNIAKNEGQFCNDILYSKGKKIDGKLCYEINRGIEFFEDSIILSDDFARKAGKSAQAGGEGADESAKILEVLSHKDNLNNYIKKANYLGVGDEYTNLGEEPDEITEEKEEMEDDAEEKYSKLSINDKFITTSRLSKLYKESKDCNEFINKVTGLIGEDLSLASKIIIRSYYDDKKNDSLKKDLMAIVVSLKEEGKTKEEIKKY